MALVLKQGLGAHLGKVLAQLSKGPTAQQWLLAKTPCLVHLEPILLIPHHPFHTHLHSYFRFRQQWHGIIAVSASLASQPTLMINGSLEPLRRVTGKENKGPQGYENNGPVRVSSTLMGTSSIRKRPTIDTLRERSSTR